MSYQDVFEAVRGQALQADKQTDMNFRTAMTCLDHSIFTREAPLSQRQVVKLVAVVVDRCLPFLLHRFHSHNAVTTSGPINLHL